MGKRVYIVGAHSRAKTLATYLKKIYKDIEIVSYLVDNDEPNAQLIDGVPVQRIATNLQLEVSNPIYIATRGVYHKHLVRKLQELGANNIFPVTPELDIYYRNLFLQIYLEEKGESFKKLVTSTDLSCIYVVKSIFDKPIKSTYALSEYEKEIQVGASLTEHKICNLMDDVGENISCKNKQFCELTALYWIWKNSKEEIVGLEHYRRRFLLTNDWYLQIKSEKVDVILPTPLCVVPTVAENYRERHIKEDWDYMMEYMRENLSKYYEMAISIFENDILYSPCNMFIMRREALNDLCEWLFPILFACVQNIGEHGDLYQNRYPGFLAERLLFLFFAVNKDRYKVVYADKIFLE